MAGLTVTVWWQPLCKDIIRWESLLPSGIGDSLTVYKNVK